ncbi:hypothetical protein [Serratia liquefaciens]|uniref:hypothetical protein n=1 Tax=Serratia liquefaciens TaxID=614 RepID=UPI00235FA870|nr:hypothetical protein [Serratia liquefaciens]
MTAIAAEFFTLDEVNRLKIIQDVIDSNLRPGQAEDMLGITPGHCSRLLERYQQSRPLGMNNQNRARTGNRLLSASLTDLALTLLALGNCSIGAGCRKLVLLTFNYAVRSDTTPAG